jgi:outer membrane protein assembly factor BamA
MPIKALFTTFWCIIILLWVGQNSGIALAQNTEEAKKIIIKKWKITGNKRTRTRIIEREIPIELPFETSLADTAELFKRIRENIFNTRLFNKVTVDLEILPDSKENFYTLKIKVEERWYLIAYPIIEFADRTINEWYYNQGADWRRINYGLRVTQNNISGNNDPLNIGIQSGFLKKYDISYRLPYFSKKQRGGLSIAANYSTNRSVAGLTEYNRQVFYKNDVDLLEIARKRTQVALSYTLRGGIYNFHEAQFGWNKNSINDSLITVNPTYYNQGATSQQFWVLRYGYRYDKRNYRLYATKGYYFQIDVEKLGLFESDDLDIGSIRLKAAKYYQLHPKLFLAFGIDILSSYPQKQPYSNTYGLGYQLRIVRGYDKFVIEGPNSFLFRSSLRFKLFEKEYFQSKNVELLFIILP